MARSEFNYLQTSELATYIHTMSGVTGGDLAASFITDAERIIDAYVGPGQRFYSQLTGNPSAAVASGATTLPSRIFGSRRPNYWAKGGVYVEVLSGADASIIGQRRLVVASTIESLTLDTGFDAALTAATQFIFIQESAFPRWWDSNVLGDPRMPPALKIATALQVEYGIAYGSEAFGLGDPAISDDQAGNIQSRSYGSGYSESIDTRKAESLARWIAPRARVILRPLLNSTGFVRR